MCLWHERTEEMWDPALFTTQYTPSSVYEVNDKTEGVLFLRTSFRISIAAS